MLMLVVVGMMPTMLVVMICASVAIMVMVIGAVNVLLAVSLLHPSSCFQEIVPARIRLHHQDRYSARRTRRGELASWLATFHSRARKASVP